MNIRRITWPEWIKMLHDAKTKSKNSKVYWSAMDTGNTAFYGGMSYDVAADSAENVYKNAPTIPHLEIPGLHVRMDDVTYDYQVTGEILDVANYISGIPEHWLMPEPAPIVGNKIIRISVEIGGNANVKAEWMRYRGNAVVTLIHALEVQGYSVELTLVRAFTLSGKEHVFIVPLKDLGEPLNTNRIQFVIGHPAFFRRCAWAVSQLLTDRDMRNAKSLSYPLDTDLHLPWNEGLSTNEGDAMQWAKTKLEEFAHRGE